MSEKTLAALFVQPDGCYAKLPFVDAWPEARDARKYDGNLPVVAHPPCQLWGNLCAVNFARWGGEHNRPGNDGGCFAAAVASVRRCGGVLEHPAMSRAFVAHGITPPVSMGWQRVTCGGWVCEVWQSAYGHRANKATWLYYFGDSPPIDLRWERIRGTHQVGMQCRQGIRASEPWRNKPSLSKQEANATPIEFRDAMIALALQSGMSDPETIRCVWCGKARKPSAYAGCAAWHPAVEGICQWCRGVETRKNGKARKHLRDGENRGPSDK